MWRPRVRVMASVGVLLALACGGQAAVAADAPAGKACVMYQTGDLKVQVVRNRALLEGAVNGRPVRVLIDTGASRSILFRATAEALHLPLSDVPGGRMGGAGGVTKVQLAFLNELRLAGTKVSNFNMTVAGEGRGADFDILLGEDVLGRFDIEFDLKHDAVRLLQPRNCGEKDMAYWASSYNETPIVGDGREQIGLVVKLNGRPVRAILDSGAATSVGTPRAASAARVSLEASEVKSRGIGALTLASEVGVLDSFSIGDETIKNTRLRFSDLFGATTFGSTGSLIAKHADDEPDMLLGFDFLKSHRVLISRSRRMIYFTYEGGPVFDIARRPAAPPGAAPAEGATPAPTSVPPSPPLGAPPTAAPGPVPTSPQAATSRSPTGS